jgi:hypothetical protein
MLVEMTVQVWIYTLDNFTELEDHTLYTWLCKCEMILYAVQQLRQTPVRICLSSIKCTRI